jgi:hypothetical protein
MHAFEVVPRVNLNESIEHLIEEHLSSLGNFQANFIKISMRRQIISCVENSPLVNRFNKQPAFAINYISVLGYAFDETTDKI